jgi:ATP/maltotriose-dependent transcriptional regulator MalT
MVELVEAAARVDDQRSAHETSERFSAIVRVAGTDWALGVNARLLALLSTGAAAETSYREAIERLGRCPMRVDRARAHLLFGEWLRRQNRRIDARAELRTAHDMFSSIGMEALAARAARELAATGERMRARTVEARHDLTAQERQIAELAIDGLSNPEIGARLFLSSRTVEWHLRKVFCKLGVSSRRELSTTLPGGNTASGQPEPTGREAASAAP